MHPVAVDDGADRGHPPRSLEREPPAHAEADAAEPRAVGLGSPLEGGGGLLQIDVAGFGGLSITPKGRALANGEGQFRCRPDAAPKTRKARSAAA